jgi:outer membrane protein assembly factor BamA
MAVLEILPLGAWSMRGRTMMRVFWLFLWVLQAYAGASLQVELRFRGHSMYSTEELIAQAGFPDEFSVLEGNRRSFIARLARTNIEEFYQSQGYFNAQVHMEVARLSPGVETYLFRIVEGELFRFRRVTVQYPAGAMQLIRSEQLGTRPGTPFQLSAIARDMQDIRMLYRRHGFLHLRIDHRELVDTTQNEVDVLISIDPGKQVRMGDFFFRSKRTGSQRPGLTRSDWMRSLWESQRGDTVDGNYLTDFRSKILGTQIFSQFVIEDNPNPQDPELSDLHLSAIERIPGDAQLGAFFEQSYGFGFLASTRHRNFLGSFHEGSLHGKVAQNRQEAILGYANPLLFGTRIRFIPTAIRLDQRLIFGHEILPLPANPDSLVERYDAASRSDLSFGIAARVRSRSTAELRYIQKEGQRQSRLKLETGLHFDFTDHPITPRWGLRVNPKVGVGRTLEPQSFLHAFQGRTYPFTEVLSSMYLPIYGSLHSAFAMDYGKYFAKASEDDAIDFYMGGSRSVRGYRFRSIAPYRNIATDSIPLRETGLTPQYLRLSQELRLDLPGKTLQGFQIVQFADWAKVQDSQADFHTAEELALGGGLRYHWQVLTFRLDYTWKKSFHTWGPEPFQLSRITFDLSQAI